MTDLRYNEAKEIPVPVKPTVLTAYNIILGFVILALLFSGVVLSFVSPVTKQDSTPLSADSNTPEKSSQPRVTDPRIPAPPATT